MKRQLDDDRSKDAGVALEDAGDRAQKRRRVGFVRIPLDKIGFDPRNRGGIGCSGYHAHEVAWDCMANKTRLTRYDHMDIVKIPEECLSEVREDKRQRCESDPLMPSYSKCIEYVAASKTHFVHGHKLFKDAGRMLHNKSDTPLKAQQGDSEAILIQEEGPLCAVYESALYHDSEAMQALSSDDNLNAGVVWGEDEMQAFGRVHQLMERMAPSQVSKGFNVKEILDALTMSGLGQFSADEWKDFIRLRAALPSPVAKVLQTCQFSACAGRVRVKVGDFGLAGKIDPRFPWDIVAIMLFQYIGTVMADTIRAESARAATFTGRKEFWSKKLQSDTIKELVAETAFLREVNTFIKSMCTVYTTPSLNGCSGMKRTNLMDARGELLANCGRHLLKVGGVLEQAVKKAASKSEVLHPEERLKILKAECADSLGRMEDNFRKVLVKNSVFAEEDLPDMKYLMKVQGEAECSNLTQGSSLMAKREASAAASSLDQGDVISFPVALGGLASTVLTDAHVYSRLEVKGCGEYVMAWEEPEELAAVKDEDIQDDDEDIVDSCGLVDVDACETKAEAEKTGWMKVRLISVSLPNAVVEVVGKKGVLSTMTLSVDDLRPLTTIKQPTKILHPTLQTGGEILDDYDYTVSQQMLAQICASQTMALAHMSATVSALNVQVIRLSDED